MRKSLLNHILKDCQRKLDKHPEHNHFMHWTYIIRGTDEIAAIGVNKGVEPDKKYGYHYNGRGVDCYYTPKTHSELDAMARCKLSLRNSIVVNVRLNKIGQARMSMPCKVCRSMLAAMKVKKVYFTTEYGWGSLW